METLRSFLSRLKAELRELKESVEFKSDLSEALEKIPESELLDKYYYDTLKNQFVPKSSIGYDSLDRTNQLLSLINEYYDAEVKGSDVYEVILPDGKEINSQIAEFSQFYNTITIEGVFEDYASTDDVRIYYYVYRGADEAKPIELAENWICMDSTKRVYHVGYFLPAKKFQVGFVNHSGRSIRLKYSFSYSSAITNSKNSFVYDWNIYNELISISVLNSIGNFNTVSIALDDATTLNFDIDISIGFGFNFANTIKIHDETITTGTTYNYEYHIPACAYVVVSLKNNKATVAKAHCNLFFSNYSEAFSLSGMVCYELVPPRSTQSYAPSLTISANNNDISADFMTNSGKVDTSKDITFHFVVRSTVTTTITFWRYASSIKTDNTEVHAWNIMSGLAQGKSCTANKVFLWSITLGNAYLDENDWQKVYLQYKGSVTFYCEACIIQYTHI